MKKIQLIFLLGALWGILPAKADTEIPYRVDVVGSQVQKIANALHLAFTLDYGHLDIPSNDQLLVRPVIIGSHDTLSLPFLLFPGKIRDKVNQRKMRLYGQEEAFPQPYATLYPTETGNALFTYEQNIPFENWMYGARVELQQAVYGCADCQKILADIPLNYIANPPQVAFIIPVPDSTREERITLYVNFPWDQSLIYPDFMNNANELAKIDRSMQSILQNRPGILRTITLTGYASPEGTYAYNTRLAGRRLESMKKYIRQKYPIEESYFVTYTVPEDWDGVRRWTDSSDLRYRQAVLDIIDNTPDPDARDNQIRGLDGNITYRRLLREAYPPLRRVEYKVNYEVEPLSVSQCRELMETHPEQLSPYELYMLAQSYPADSPEFDAIILTTVRLYPNDAAANTNAAAVALKQENFAQAREYLLRTGDCPQALNNQGVLLMLEGNLQEAYQCFLEAGQCGCREGIVNQHNLDRAQLR